MAKEKMKSYSLADMKDEFIGKVGTKERDDYEYELRMDVLGKMIKTARQERNLTQEQLGELVGVQKSQISKLKFPWLHEFLRELLYCQTLQELSVLFHRSYPVKLHHLLPDILQDYKHSEQTSR